MYGGTHYKVNSRRRGKRSSSTFTRRHAELCRTRRIDDTFDRQDIGGIEQDNVHLFRWSPHHADIVRVCPYRVNGYESIRRKGHDLCQLAQYCHATCILQNWSHGPKLEMLLITARNGEFGTAGVAVEGLISEDAPVDKVVLKGNGLGEGGSGEGGLGGRELRDRQGIGAFQFSCDDVIPCHGGHLCIHGNNKAGE